MNKLLLSILLSMLIDASNAQIYKRIDSKGQIQFSDSSQPSSDKLDIIEPQSYSSPGLTTISSVQKSEKKHSYQKISIIQPLDQSTIRNNQGSLSVTVRLEPDLFAGDTISILIDGSPVNSVQNGLLFHLMGIYRGEHRIAVRVQNANGDVLNTSPTITIYMQRPRVGMSK